MNGPRKSTTPTDGGNAPITPPPETPDQWAGAGETVSLHGHQVFFRDIPAKDAAECDDSASGSGDSDAAEPGSGATICLHGFPTSSFDWVWLCDALSAHDRLILPDLLDYGRSTTQHGKAASIMAQADMVTALAEHLGLTEIRLLAHDVGDTVAQELLARQLEKSLPFRITRCLFLNGGIVPELHRPRRAQKLLASPLGGLVARLMAADRFKKAFAAVFSKKHQPDAALLDLFWDEIMGKQGRPALARRIRYMAERKAYESRWVGALKGTTVPLMMINGLDDPVSGVHMADVLSIRVPDMKVERLAGVGHYPQVEAPDQVAPLAIGFLFADRKGAGPDKKGTGAGKKESKARKSGGERPDA
ncbi:alpha/beta fold hydrolase [Yunchengibacter salinarum]|uniref:alpha/beta fold hydrolase n=1 Tax=Yunchengibacter salinarum TaxID=3133399 RepID=UPI0035B5AC43